MFFMQMKCLTTNRSSDVNVFSNMQILMMLTVIQLTYYKPMLSPMYYYHVAFVVLK